MEPVGDNEKWVDILAIRTINRQCVAEGGWMEHKKVDDFQWKGSTLAQIAWSTRQSHMDVISLDGWMANGCDKFGGMEE